VILERFEAPHFDPRGAFGVRAAHAGGHLLFGCGVHKLPQFVVEIVFYARLLDEGAQPADHSTEQRHHSSPKLLKPEEFSISQLPALPSRGFRASKSPFPAP
jgi:hypothetical protein